MENWNIRLLIQDARQKLAGRDAHRLAALHTGVTVVAALAVTLLQYALALGIGKTSGLSGLGTRSILETIQSVLQFANSVLLPFWSLGFLYAAMQWAGGRDARKEDLLTGFRRFGPYLRLLLLRMLIVIAVMVVCGNIAAVVYMMTPASSALMEMATTAGGDANALTQMLTQTDGEQMQAILQSMIPMLVIWGVLCCALLLPLLYRFRLAEYAILERPGTGALAAMGISTALTRRRCLKLLGLDLRLWWYYALKGLCMAVCYADLILEAMGVSLPVTGDGAALITYLLYLAGLFAVETLFRPQVETAYADAYAAMTAMGPAPGKTPTLPKNVPWDEP